MVNTPILDLLIGSLTGGRPLSWQRRLYEQWLRDDVPAEIDIPTGLGKTMLMAVWYAARLENPRLGRRLVYVVDRRTVVDQASDVARKMAEAVRDLGQPEIAISTLRGQHADDRRWTEDPAQIAIIVGTIDLIGSALLFSGYRSGFKRRPLEAGFLGQDAMLILDEAHLSLPFETLVGAIGADGRFQKAADGSPQGEPLRVVSMSATKARSGALTGQFCLELDGTGDLSAEDAADPVVAERYNAPKKLTVQRVGAKASIVAALAQSAIELAVRPEALGRRIVIFTRRPEDAGAIAKILRQHQPAAGGDPAREKRPFANSVEVLVGTMRGFERNHLVCKPVMQRFLDADEDLGSDAATRPAFLICTSAGEVGIDLNADHLVGDAAPLDSWIQRLGRVNRRGKAEADVWMLLPAEPPEKTSLDRACSSASALFSSGMDVSPRAIRAILAGLCEEQLRGALSPVPGTVPLTTILLDTWSMTTIKGRIPGRPEVEPWIRGADAEIPPTTIAWRAELDIPGFASLDVETVEEWFDAHRLLAHETLQLPSPVAGAQLAERWSLLTEDAKAELDSATVVIERAGETSVFSPQLFFERLAREERSAGASFASIRHATVVLPAAFGGLSPEGTFDPRADAASIGDEPARTAKSADVADLGPIARTRSLRFGDGEPCILGTASRAPERPSRFEVKLFLDDGEVSLLSETPKWERLESGSQRQSLGTHVSLVRGAADALAARLNLPLSLARVLSLAADWHDHGKNREFFQRTVDGKVSAGGPPWADATIGKSGG